MPLEAANSHHCRQRALESDCPVCGESLFDSSSPAKELACGHFMHADCLQQHLLYSYTCPVCCRSLGDMSAYFEMLDALLAAEHDSLPQQYQGVSQRVHCHDCGSETEAPFHFVYHKCQKCRRGLCQTKAGTPPPFPNTAACSLDPAGRTTPGSSRRLRQGPMHPSCPGF